MLFGWQDKIIGARFKGIIPATLSIELLKNYLSSNLGKMYLSDNQTCDVIGKGEVHIKLNGFIWNLNNWSAFQTWGKILFLLGNERKVAMWQLLQVTHGKSQGE